MSGVNKVIIVGYMGNEPDVRTLPNGAMTATISVATSEKWTDKVTGEKRESTEWHRIVLWEKQAEVMAQYGHKGTQVYVEGSLRTRKWQDQNGQDRYTTEIQGDVLQMLGGRNQAGDFGGNGGGSWNQAPQTTNYNQGNTNYGNGYSQAPAQSAPKPVQAEPPVSNFADDDIPF